MANMDLQIDYSQTRSTGTNVQNKADDFHTLLGKINTINNNLKSAWEGQDAAKYSTAVEQQAATMQKLQEKMDEIGKFLVEVGNTYEKVSQENAAAIKTN